MQTRRGTVTVLAPISNSQCSEFNSYRVRFEGPEMMFPDEMWTTRVLRATLQRVCFHDGRWEETLFFNTHRTQQAWPPGGAWGTVLPFEQWQGFGQPSFTHVVGRFDPPMVGESAILHVRSTDWMAPGAPLFIEGGTYQVVGRTGPNSVNVRRIN